MDDIGPRLLAWNVGTVNKDLVHCMKTGSGKWFPWDQPLETARKRQEQSLWDINPTHWKVVLKWTELLLPSWGREQRGMYKRWRRRWEYSNTPSHREESEGSSPMKSEKEGEQWFLTQQSQLYGLQPVWWLKGSCLEGLCVWFNALLCCSESFDNLLTGTWVFILLWPSKMMKLVLQTRIKIPVTSKKVTVNWSKNCLDMR